MPYDNNQHHTTPTNINSSKHPCTHAYMAPPFPEWSKHKSASLAPETHIYNSLPPWHHFTKTHRHTHCIQLQLPSVSRNANTHTDTPFVKGNSTLNPVCRECFASLTSRVWQVQVCCTSEPTHHQSLVWSVVHVSTPNSDVVLHKTVLQELLYCTRCGLGIQRLLDARASRVFSMQ